MFRMLRFEQSRLQGFHSVNSIETITLADRLLLVAGAYQFSTRNYHLSRLESIEFIIVDSHRPTYGYHHECEI